MKVKLPQVLRMGVKVSQSWHLGPWGYPVRTPKVPPQCPGLYGVCMTVSLQYGEEDWTVSLPLTFAQPQAG